MATYSGPRPGGLRKKAVEHVRGSSSPVSWELGPGQQNGAGKYFGLGKQGAGKIWISMAYRKPER